MVVLVVYASRFGATRSIAERIAVRLREHGQQVVVHPAERPIDAAIYDAVVVGSPVYNRAWLPAAADFVRRNLDALAGRPVRIFSVGGLRHPGRWGRIGVRTYPNQIRGFRGYVVPGTATTLHIRAPTGRYALDRTRPRSVFAGRFGDFRDWQDVDTWANQVASALTRTATGAVSSL